jgi:hypothetical protein
MGKMGQTCGEQAEACTIHVQTLCQTPIASQPPQCCQNSSRNQHTNTHNGWHPKRPPHGSTTPNKPEPLKIPLMVQHRPHPTLQSYQKLPETKLQWQWMWILEPLLRLQQLRCVATSQQSQIYGQKTVRGRV